MIGQEAANVAREFNEQLEVTGVILAKIVGIPVVVRPAFCPSDYWEANQVHWYW